MKTHLKRIATDRLTLCGIYADKNWVLRESAQLQAAGTVCKICTGITESVSFKVATQKSRTSKAAPLLAKHASHNARS